MSVAVIGAGGIGAVMAAAAGGPVTLCVRTPVPELVVMDPAGQWSTVPARLATSPAGVDGKADVVVVTVKATDTAGAAGWLAALCSPSTLVVVAQNGLGHADRVAPYLPAGATAVPGLAYIAAERLAAGRVRHLAGRLLIVPSEVAGTVASALPGLDVRGEDDITTACWRKLLDNVVANPLTALTMRRIEVMREPEIADLARGLLAETVAVGRASGADLSEEVIERTVARTARYGPDTGSSMLYDRLAGRHTEHQYLTGEVVRRGRALGIPVPLNTAVLALLEAIDRALP